MSKIQPGCTVTILPNGKLDQVRTLEGCVINHIVMRSMEFRQDLDEIKHGYKRLKLELYIREEDIVHLTDLGTGTMEQSVRPLGEVPEWAETL